jgi:hypothetical protein
MRKLAFVILALFCFGPQFYFGFAGTGVLTPVFWSLGAALFAVGTGWRAAQQNILTSVLIGTCYAAAANVPLYLFGQWLGNPATGSIGLTALVSAIGLLIFGSLALLRRKWPQAPSHDHATTTDKSEAQWVTDDAFKKLHQFMDSESAQNKRLIEPHRSKVRAGADCDEMVGVVGEFGRDPRNPIPVNGPLGEIIYLSNLRTDSQHIMFHRLGAVSNVDVYETVSLDGAKWDILFLHQYHPRKSRVSPSGYQIVTGPERNRLLLGVDEFVAEFPNNLADAIASMSERIFKFRVRPQQVSTASERVIFSRPAAHVERLNIILSALKRRS